MPSPVWRWIGRSSSHRQRSRMAFRQRLMPSEGVLSESAVLWIEAEQWQWRMPPGRTPAGWWRDGGASVRHQYMHDADCCAEALSSAAGLKCHANLAIADGVKCVRFCREMDEIINSLCFLLLSLSHQPFSWSTTGAKPSPG